MCDSWDRKQAESVLKSEADLLKITLSEQQIKKLLDFGELVFEGNKRLNLTGKLNWPILVYKHSSLS